MTTGNQTNTKGVILLGFYTPYHFKIPFFLLIFILYSLTVIANIMIVTLVSSSSSRSSLRHPMFFFLSHLSLSDMILTASIVPIMLCGIIKGQVTMSIADCITQFYFFGIALASESLLLGAMSFDRYLAVCNPLRYRSIMDQKLCLQLVSLCWGLSITISLTMAVMMSSLQFCGLNIIDHFFCDFFPILQLSCSETSTVKLGQMLIASPAAWFPFVFTVVTYVYIFITVLRIPSTSGRQKAFSTFSSHLSIVCIFFGSIIALYLVPSPAGTSFNANKFVSMLYTVVTPLLNPVIYSLRNVEIKTSLKKYMWAMRKVTKL
ncbi:hypothetical protein GDO86_016411 [Hymenochirus boettgeri]|uniref:Olfactory receptor n=1 Tax=Hymenochirus boettgeri TaxID=247094 RepID=A0A8T2K556_9PIPI|nr:hypothetical protein GDO86_016411 [Hymenochirus boettgeri]